MLSCIGSTGLRSAEKFPAPSIVFKSTVVFIMIINLPGYLVIFPSTNDGKIQWSTSGIENEADFCYFVT